MPARLAVIPGAKVMSAPFSSCRPSGRVSISKSGLKAPALVACGPKAKLGANGRAAIVGGQGPPPGRSLRANSSPGVAAGLPDQGVIEVAVWFGPQVGGLLSTARAPGSNWRRKELNGTCGFSAKVV